MNLLISLLFGAVCFILGYALCYLRMYGLFMLYEQASKIQDELDEVNQQLSNCCEHGFENWDECPVCGH